MPTMKCIIAGILLILSIQLHAHNQPYCDSIIKKGVVSMLDKKYATALLLLTDAQHMAAENHWQKQLFLSTNNIGLTYYFTG
jgi:hypothetical protein